MQTDYGYIVKGTKYGYFWMCDCIRLAGLV